MHSITKQYNFISIVKNVKTSLPKFFEISPNRWKNKNFWGYACNPCTPNSHTTEFWPCLLSRYNKIVVNDKIGRAEHSLQVTLWVFCTTNINTFMIPDSLRNIMIRVEEAKVVMTYSEKILSTFCRKLSHKLSVEANPCHANECQRQALHKRCA